MLSHSAIVHRMKKNPSIVHSNTYMCSRTGCTCTSILYTFLLGVPGISVRVNTDANTDMYVRCNVCAGYMTGEHGVYTPYVQTSTCS